MKIQRVGNYDCQKKDVDFKAGHLQNNVLRLGVEKARIMPSQVYKERGFMDFLEHPIRFTADLIWTISNGAIGRLTRAMNRC